MTVVGEPEVTGNTVRFNNTLELDLFKAMGLGIVDAVSEAVVEEGKITTYTFALTPESAARLQAAMK